MVTTILKGAFSWALARLHEKSTWSALVTLAATLIVRHQVDPALAANVTTAGLSLVTAIAAITKEPPHGHA